MSGHTPGPWLATQPAKPTHAGACISILSADDDTEIIARIYVADEKAQANATLIAAAPDLLETLKSIHACYGLGSTPEKFCEHVHDLIVVDAAAAISRATEKGET